MVVSLDMVLLMVLLTVWLTKVNIHIPQDKEAADILVVLTKLMELRDILTLHLLFNQLLLKDQLVLLLMLLIGHSILQEFSAIAKTD